MSWECRKRGKKYFYRSVRVDGRVVKKYLGHGNIALRASSDDEYQRAKRQVTKAANCRALEQVDQTAEALQHFADQFEVLLQASLAAAGFHCHRSCWRRRKASS